MKLWKLPVWMQISFMGFATFMLFTNSIDFVCNGEERENIGAGVMYEVAAKVIWDQTTHPENFQSNLTFSPFVFVVHLEDETFWEEGNQASPGMKLYCETGDHTLLETELQAMKTNRQIFDYYISTALDQYNGIVEQIIESSFEYDHYSMVMRMDPSPDWFIGVTNMPFKRYSDVDNSYIWRVNESTNMYPMDAGTYAGSDFNSSDDTELTMQPIRTFAAPNSYPFFNPTMNTVRPVGKFTLRKI